MRLTVVAIGRIKDRHLLALIDDYAKRMGRYGTFRVIEVKESKGAPSAEETRRRESEALLRAAPDRTFRVLLDERGTLMRSSELARRMDEAALHGDGDWTFFIGGAEGHDDLLRSECDLIWSLSPLTLPHELCRLVLVEQLYRSQTIRAGELYHRE